jgi:transcriptional regulator with XRE-family HTH domain
MAKKFSTLRAKMSPASRARAELRTKAMLAEVRLDELRRARQVTQEALAVELETTQPEVSKMERRVDMYVSTLRRYVEALGGRLEITAHFPDSDVRINQFSELATS